MTGAPPPVYALCGVDFTTNKLPSFGRAVVADWHDDATEPGGYRGLPWGVGEPGSALLEFDDWAVVRIEDPLPPVPVPGAVKFRAGTVIYSGDPRGALETLMQYGADPRAMSVKLAMPGEIGVADAGPYGVAVGGRSGLSRGAEHSRALVERGFGGVAVVAAHGQAIATCSHGIAVAGPSG